MPTKRVILNECGVEVSYDIHPPQIGDNDTPSFPEQYEFHQVNYQGIDIIPFLSERQFEIIKEEIK